jgi:hypothetical protein
LLGLSGELVDFGSMQEESPAALGFMLLVARAQVGLNVAVVEKDLSAFDAREGALQVYEAGADRLDLGALKLDPGLKGFQNMIIPERLAIGDDLRGHGTPAPRKLFLGLLAVWCLTQNQLALSNLS